MNCSHVGASAQALIGALRAWRRGQWLPLVSENRALCVAIDRWEGTFRVEAQERPATNSPYMVATIDELIGAFRTWRYVHWAVLRGSARRLAQAIEQWECDYAIEIDEAATRQ